MLSEDFVAFTDGGGVVSAAVRPVYGAARFATVIMHLSRRAIEEAPEDAPPEFGFERCNGSWALVIRQGGEVHSCTFVDIDRVGESAHLCARRVYVVRNPDKLRHL